MTPTEKTIEDVYKLFSDWGCFKDLAENEKVSAKFALNSIAKEQANEIRQELSDIMFVRVNKLNQYNPSNS